VASTSCSRPRRSSTPRQTIPNGSARSRSTCSRRCSSSMHERLFLRLDEDPLHGPEADIPAGTLRAWPVRESLRSHVAHILQYREVIPSGTEVQERVMPDGAVRLVFNTASPPSTGSGAGRPAEVIGASATP